MKTSQLLIVPFAAVLLTAVCLTNAGAQIVGARIDKNWEFLINKPGILLPTLTNQVTDTSDNDNGDGHYTMDSLSALRRYDSTRLILGIRENGINESDPNLT